MFYFLQGRNFKNKKLIDLNSNHPRVFCQSWEICILNTWFHFRVHILNLYVIWTLSLKLRANKYMPNAFRCIEKHIWIELFFFIALSVESISKLKASLQTSVNICSNKIHILDLSVTGSLHLITGSRRKRSAISVSNREVFVRSICKYCREK